MREQCCSFRRSFKAVVEPVNKHHQRPCRIANLGLDMGAEISFSGSDRGVDLLDFDSLLNSLSVRQRHAHLGDAEVDEFVLRRRVCKRTHDRRRWIVLLRRRIINTHMIDAGNRMSLKRGATGERQQTRQPQPDFRQVRNSHAKFSSWRNCAIWDAKRNAFFLWRFQFLI